MDFVEEASQRSKHQPTLDYIVTGVDPVVIAIRGEVDIFTAPSLASVLEDLTLFNKRIALDLGAVDFFDSTGLHIVEKATASLREAGGELQVAAVSERVRRVVELAGMTELISLPTANDEKQG